MKIYRYILVGLSACILTQAAEQKAKKKPEKWKHSAAFELTGKTGPIEQKRHAGFFTSLRQTKTNRLKMYARYAWAETGEVKSQDEYIVGIDDEINATSHTAAYARFEAEHDDIEMLRLRTTVATGVSYYFVKKDVHKLRGRLGASWREDDYQAAEDTRTTGAEAGIYNEFKNKKIGLWTTEVVYAPSLEEDRIYLIKYQSKLSMPLSNIDGLSTEFGVFGQYNSYTPGPVEHATTSYFARVKFTW